MPRLTYDFNRFRRFVLALSGAHLQTLDLVPTERGRFESLGWAILITSGLAVVSMWFALASAVGVNGILAIPVALFWGIVIMGIDRWLVTSMPVDENRKWAIAIPRVVLAILLGTLISTPLVLRVFESEINAQIAKVQESNYNSYLQTQKNSQLTKEITTYSSELTYLNGEINSHGTSTGNTASDPELVAYSSQLTSLNSQLSKWAGLKTKYYQDYTCQKYGGANCPKVGVGPAANASLASYNQASAEVTKIQGEINTVQKEIQTRDQQISDNSASAAQDRYQEALNQRPLIQNEYNTAVQQQNQLQQSYYAQNQASHGILVRLEALSQLSDSNTTVAVARILLFLLFLVIELLPVTVKLLQKPGHYESALQRAKVAESREVDMYYSTWSGYQGGAQPVAAAAPPAVMQQPTEPRQPAPRSTSSRQASAVQSADVFGIWNPTRIMNQVVGDPQDEAGTQVLGNREGPEFPPSEGDPRAARGWRQPPAPVKPAEAPVGEPTLDRLDRPLAPADPAVAQTRVDHGFDVVAPTRGEYPPESRTQRLETAQEPAFSWDDDDRSTHEALNEIDEEETTSAHSDGASSGVLLNWDDE